MNITKEENINITNLIDTKTIDNNLELEIRFGNFIKKKITSFQTGITSDAFDRVINFVKKFATYSSTEYAFMVTHELNKIGEGVIRVTQKLGKPDNNELLSYPWINNIEENYQIIKTTVRNVDIFEYNIRFSLSSEVPLKEQVTTKPIFFKSRKRLIYIFQNYTIHCTIYKCSNDLNKIMSEDLRYDIEIELNTGNLTVTENIYKFILEFINAINDTKYYLKTSILTEIKTAYFKLTGTNRFIGVQPMTIKNDLIDIDKEYACTIKLNGVRQLLFVYKSDIYTISTKMVFKYAMIKCNSKYDNTIMDSELFSNRIYLFDLIIDSGKDLRNNNLSTIKQRIDILNGISKIINNVRVTVKEYYFSKNFYQNSMGLLKKYFSNYPYDYSDITDGLIYVETGKEYINKPLKWKPDNLLTIDFKIKKIGVKMNLEKWDLYCNSVENNDILFSYPDYPESIGSCIIDLSISNKFIDNSIVECIFDKETEQFIPIKSRPDKINGNYIEIAIDNFKSILNPFDFELTNKNTPKSQGDPFFHIKRFQSYIKLQLLMKYSNRTHNLLAINCGNGSDIGSWLACNIKNVKGIDSDISKLQQAQRRAESVSENPTSKNFKFDFSESLEKGQSENDSFDTCTYFFCENPNMNELLKLTKNLKIGGKLIITTIEKEKVINPTETQLFKIKISQNQKNVNINGNTFGILDIESITNSEFRLLEEQTFDKYYEQWKNNGNYLDLVKRKYAFLYKSYVFQKQNQFDMSTLKNVLDESIIKKDTRSESEESISENEESSSDESGEEVYTQEDLNILKLIELKAICKELKLSQSGKKSDIIERIMKST